MISKTRRPCIAVVTALLCAITASAQENRGTPEQRAACAPDAFRLCAGYILDPARVEFCLRQSKSDLSDACRSLFEQTAGGSQQKQITKSWAAIAALPNSYANAAEMPCEPATRS